MVVLTVFVQQHVGHALPHGKLAARLGTDELSLHQMHLGTMTATAAKQQMR